MVDMLKVFGSEETTLEFLMEHRIIFEDRRCPKCDGPMKLVFKRHYILRCPISICRQQIALTKGTIFYKSKVPLNYCLYIVYLFSKKVEIMKIVDICGINYRSIKRIVDRLYYIIGYMLEEIDTKIGGPGIVVEIDESKFGKRKYNRGHPVDGVWIVGGVERTPERKIFLVKVLRRDQATLSDIIRRYVLPGSIIYTDMWRGYNNLHLHGYTHMTVNHSQNFVDPVTNVHTNAIEGNWSAIKRNTSIRKRTYRLIDNSLNEFMFRRLSDDNYWDKILECMKEVDFEVGYI